MKNFFSIVLISLLSILAFSIGSIKLNASEINACIYITESKDSYIGVNSNRKVYSFNDSTGELGSELGTAIDGSYGGGNACERKIHKYTGHGEVLFSNVDCTPSNWVNNSGFTYTIPSECEFLTGDNSNNIAAQTYANSYKKISYDRIALDEMTQFNEKAASEARNLADEDYVECLTLRHGDSYRECQSLHANEMNDLINCVKQKVSASGGTYRCDVEEQALLSADKAYRSAKSGSLIAINLGEMSCEDLLTRDFIDELKSLFFIIQVLAVAIAVVLTAADFAKFVFGGDEDKYKAMFKNLKTRIAVIILLLIVPYLIEFILSTTMGGDIPANPFCE